MAKSKKYYVVWEGQNPGVYDNWNDCKLQIAGYPNARYKSFKSLSEAKAAYYDVYSDHVNHTASRERDLEHLDQTDVIWESISVDAACGGNPGIMEYQGVDTATGDQLFYQGPFEQGTNNVGEFLALVHALALLKKQGKSKLPIYTDSRTALAWIRNKKVKTTLKKTKKNAVLFSMMDRAIKWLESNSFANPLLKWETKKWGEIPADFGRK